MKNILLLGGSGFIGRHVCAALVRAGHEVTVATRRSAHARHLQTWPRLTVQQADVFDPAQLQSLMHGHDVVIQLIAVLHGNDARFEQMHVALPQLVAQSCVAAGVPELIHVSALGADPQGPSRYQRSKGRGEAALHAVAQSSGLRLTLVRPSVVFGTDDRFINLFARMQKVLPVVPLAGASARFQPVWVQDVSLALAHLVRHDSWQGRTYELGGPEVLTLADLVRHAGHFAGCPRPIIPLPHAMAWLQTTLMELAPGEPLMSRDNLASMQRDNVLSGQCPGLRELGLAPGHSLASVFPI
ncbi:MAG: complex I NDUFA9 subunit family protein [Alphaproteobacteria bacterium]|nr:complex I NDUFA9 subunit family protein [Alphaproteobacteria bacterium]MDI9329873.1 complex I NDUFA9 subunit family protein [Alphaproteobacteria bacterium]